MFNNGSIFNLMEIRMQSVLLINPPSHEPSKTHGETHAIKLDAPNQMAQIDPEVSKAAKDFETAFIAQMLKFSGLAEAITTGGGEDVAAFTDFYIQSFAEEISDTGGFGLAEQFYDKLILKAREGAISGAQNVKF